MMSAGKKAPEFVVDRKRSKNRITGSTPLKELQEFSKEELIARIQQLEAHTFQLKNIIRKSGNKEEEPLNQEDGKKQSTSVRKNAGRQFDFTKCTKRRILIKLLYLGWDLDGYAVQDNSANTVEHHLFNALTKSCLIENRQSSNYHRCGRTDKGVSAFSQVISIDVRSSGNASGELPYCKMLNRLLPDEIRALCWAPAPSSEFSARFDCTRRKYRYFFPRGCLDLQAMAAAAALLLGGHDFRNFCKMDVGNGVVDYKRSVFQAEVKVANQINPQVEGPFDLCELVIEGKAFLWHQIRCIVSVLLLVGEGKEDASIVSQLLDPEKPKPQYPLAVDFPLVLFQCDYEHDLHWQFEQEELTRVVLKMQSMWASNAIKSAMIKEMVCCLEEKLEVAVKGQADALVMGVKPKVYQPLLKRNTCSSLESKIDHYVKRRKLKKSEEKQNDN
ncbi:tRNA pseudouridine(38/39) synthase [Neocloeon triangulifer]|uniref:tRNA pseudouridine(38/39) synthase n=1 Tax=Neocloeon triangulifer TaxID=2078957 RepID=UPI00286EE947|nr:tRNA pseudouridine(38/39) synthase [Neocloeon triangulifer]